MIVTTHEQLSDEELLKECDKQFGNPLIVELKKRLASYIDSQQSYEDEIQSLQEKAEAVEETAAESIAALQAEVVSLKEALDLLA